MKQVLSILLLLASCVQALAGCGKEEAGAGSAAGDRPDKGETVNSPDIYQENTDGYRSFRIPAIIATQEGTLLAFAEGRKYSGSDSGDIDLVVRRSEDGGQTWSALSVIWDDGGNTCGNPAPVVDPATGRIHLLSTWNHGDDTIGMINQGTSNDTRRVFHLFSDDDGLTWSKPEEITSQAKNEEWGWYATGPCHGIAISAGKYQGRLVIPCDCIEIGAGRKQYSFVIWSDDHGKTWEYGETLVNGNECTVAETSDGRLVLNMRNPGTFRMLACSEDGGQTWSKSEENRDLIDPVCQGSMLNALVDGEHMLYFSNAASSTRDHMTVKKSSDNGKNWDSGILIYDGPSAYSDIVELNEHEIAILYENGVQNPYQKISFKIIKK